jgi:hypothetical protein
MKRPLRQPLRSPQSLREDSDRAARRSRPPRIFKVRAGPLRLGCIRPDLESVDSPLGESTLECVRSLKHLQTLETQTRRTPSLGKER